jgi:multiple antibiotic resistance protein
MSIQEMIVSLFFIMNPIGIIPMELSLLEGLDDKKRRKIILRECLIALGFMFIFMFFGSTILAALNVSMAAAQVAGGVIVFIIGLRMVIPPPKIVEREKVEPLIVPIATPLFAGPGLLSTIMLYSRHVENRVELLVAIFSAWLISAIILLSSQFIGKVLGKSGVDAVERLFGLILTIIAINMIGTGYFTFSKMFK